MIIITITINITIIIIIFFGTVHIYIYMYIYIYCMYIQWAWQHLCILCIMPWYTLGNMTNNRIYSTWVYLEMVCIPPIMVIDVFLIGKIMMNYQCGTPISLGYAGKTQLMQPDNLFKGHLQDTPGFAGKNCFLQVFVVLLTNLKSTQWKQTKVEKKLRSKCSKTI